MQNTTISEINSWNVMWLINNYYFFFIYEKFVGFFEYLKRCDNYETCYYLVNWVNWRLTYTRTDWMPAWLVNRNDCNVFNCVALLLFDYCKDNIWVAKRVFFFLLINSKHAANFLNVNYCGLNTGRFCSTLYQSAI